MIEMEINLPETAKFGVITGEMTSEAGELSLGTLLAGVGVAGNQRVRGTGREESQAGLGGILFLMRFDSLVNAKVFASFNLDQTGDLENKLLCAAGVKLSGSVEMLVFQPAPGWGKN